MKPKFRLAWVTTVALLLAFCLAGCSTNADQENPPQSNAEATAKELKYFELLPEMPTPDSVISAADTGESSSSSNGITTSVAHYYKIEAEDETAAQNELSAYLEAIKQAEISVLDQEENKWAAIYNETEVARLSYDPASYQLTVTVLAEGNRTKMTEITLGQTVEANDYTFTLSNIEWLKEIYPPDTSGYYTYYPEQPNKTFCVVTGTFKYTGGNQFNFKNTRLQFEKMNGKYNFAGSPEYALDGGVEGLNKISNFYSLEPLSEVPLYLYSSIPDEVANDFTGGTLTWKFPDGNEYYLNFS